METRTDITPPIAKVKKAIEEIKKGKMVILCDDEDRENEGDLTMAAEKVTPEAINFMAKYGRGLICLSLTEEKVQQLDLPLMVHTARTPLRFRPPLPYRLMRKKGPRPAFRLQTGQ